MDPTVIVLTYVFTSMTHTFYTNTFTPSNHCSHPFTSHLTALPNVTNLADDEPGVLPAVESVFVARLQHHLHRLLAAEHEEVDQVGLFEAGRLGQSGALVPGRQVADDVTTRDVLQQRLVLVVHHWQQSGVDGRANGEHKKKIFHRLVM